MARDLYPETALTGHIPPEKPCQTTITDTPVSTLYSNRLQLSRKDYSSGTTAGEYALPAVQSKLRELRRRLAPLALCHVVRNRRTHTECETEKHLGRFKAETRPRCLCFFVFCRIFGTPRSIFTAKATEVSMSLPFQISQ